MNDFDTEVNNIGRQRAIAFFVPRLIVLAAVALGLIAFFA